MQTNQSKPRLNLVGILLNGDIVKKIGLPIHQPLQSFQPCFYFKVNIICFDNFILGTNFFVCKCSDHFLLKFDIRTENNTEILRIVDCLNGLFKNFSRSVEFSQPDEEVTYLDPNFALILRIKSKCVPDDSIWVYALDFIRMLGN